MNHIIHKMLAEYAETHGKTIEAATFDALDTYFTAKNIPRPKELSRTVIERAVTDYLNQQAMFRLNLLETCSRRD